MSEATTQDQAVVSAPQAQGVSLGNAALTRKYAKLATLEAFNAALISGDEKIVAQYEADMRELYVGIGAVGAKFSAATQVSAAYLVRAMDQAVTPAGKPLVSADMETVRKALATTDADGETVLPSKSRVSQFRLSGRVIFDLGWPQDAKDFGPMLTTRQNAKGMSAHIKADGATVETVRQAWILVRDGKGQTVIEGSGTTTTGSGSGSESGGTGAQLGEGEVSVKKSAKAAMDTIEAAVLALPTELSDAEVARLAELSARIEAFIDGLPNGTAGRELAKKSDAS